MLMLVSTTDHTTGNDGTSSRVGAHLSHIVPLLTQDNLDIGHRHDHLEHNILEYNISFIYILYLYVINNILNYRIVSHSTQKNLHHYHCLTKCGITSGVLQHGNSYL